MPKTTRKNLILFLVIIVIIIFLVVYKTKEKQFMQMTINQYSDEELIKSERIDQLKSPQLMSLVGLEGDCLAGICCDKETPNICWNEELYELASNTEQAMIAVGINNNGNVPLNIEFLDNKLSYWKKTDTVPVQYENLISVSTPINRIEIGGNIISTTSFIDVSNIEYISADYKNFIQFNIKGTSDFPEQPPTTKTFNWYFKIQRIFTYVNSGTEPIVNDINTIIPEITPDINLGITINPGETYYYSRIGIEGEEVYVMPIESNVEIRTTSYSVAEEKLTLDIYGTGTKEINVYLGNLEIPSTILVDGNVITDYTFANSILTFYITLGSSHIVELDWDEKQGIFTYTNSEAKTITKDINDILKMLPEMDIIITLRPGETYYYAKQIIETQPIYIMPNESNVEIKKMMNLNKKLKMKIGGSGTKKIYIYLANLEVPEIAFEGKKIEKFRLYDSILAFDISLDHSRFLEIKWR